MSHVMLEDVNNITLMIALCNFFKCIFDDLSYMPFTMDNGN